MSKWIWITAARLKIDSDCGRGSGVSQPNFWSIVAILLLLTFFSIKIQSTSWKCNELSFFNHCKSLDMTVHLWQCHIWSPTQSAKCNAAMQNVTKCPPASKHTFMFHAQIIFCFPCFGLTLQFYMTTVCWLYVHSLGFFNSYIDLNQYTQYEEKAHFSTAYFVFKESLMPV